ncbi:uncharacterized protein LOC124812640 [Hydra vulgaris]|uniref:uncharacterized protein LOC124812640 n=1 Tax=Hydra vulgaris TaxID=6087 RepID=UPI001F5F6FF2|nr:uncharacterized protein LOC124812640 [Hydra vulgaris]
MHRWEVLIKHTNISVKRLSTTRWSAHYNAVKPLQENFEKFIEAIEALCSTNENLDTRGAAESLLPATKGLSLDKVIIKIEALSLFLNEERQNVVDKALNKALCVSKEHDIPIERRIRLRKKMAGELICDTKLTIEEENKRTMYECIDCLNVELQARSKPLKNILGMFECVQAKFLVSEHNNEEDLTLSIKKLTSFYDEISHYELIFEIPRLKGHLKAARINLETLEKDVEEIKRSLNFHEHLFEEKIKTTIASQEKKHTSGIDKLNHSSDYVKIKSKLRKMEDRSRRNNIRVDGLKESEGETWIESELKFSKVFEDHLGLTNIWIERAHRTG